MNLYIIITTRKSGALFQALAKACTRNKIQWSVFFTGNGVEVLRNQEFLDATLGAKAAIVCQESWSSLYKDVQCPVDSGSQLNNSMMVEKADKILSF